MVIIKTDKTRINEAIRAKELRVIDEEGNQLGILTKDEALKLAEEKGVDVVEVAPKANPPVCKIMDYGKYRYWQQKKEKEAKKKQTVIKMKEMTFRPKIDKHDYEFKKKHIISFLNGGDRVKIVMFYRGRQLAHIEVGRKILDDLKSELSEISDVEREPMLEGRRMIMILTPKKETQ